MVSGARSREGSRLVRPTSAGELKIAKARAKTFALAPALAAFSRSYQCLISVADSDALTRITSSHATSPRLAGPRCRSDGRVVRGQAHALTGS